MHVDDYVWIGLNGLVKLIDQHGGVGVMVTNPVLVDFYPSDLSNAGDPYAYYRVAVLPGATHLDGVRALELHSLLSQAAEQPAPALVSTLAQGEYQAGGKTVNGIRKTVAAAAIAGSMLVGGVAGAVLYGATMLTASAATNAASPAPTPGTAPAGKFVPNETAAHEATESAAREAQENAGQVPTVP